MIKLFKYFRKNDLIKIILSLIFISTQVWLDLKVPDYMSEITRLIQMGKNNTEQILTQGGYMMICVLASVTASIFVGYFAANVAASLARKLRSILFDKVLNFSAREINKFSTASLITRSTNDITQIQFIITLGLQVMVKAPIMAVWAIYKIHGKGFEWSLATFIGVCILCCFTLFTLLFVLPKFKIMQSLIDDLNLISRENLLGLRVIKAYNAEKYQLDKFEKNNSVLTKTQLFTSKSMSFLFPIINMILNGLTLAIYWIGAYLINNASLEDKFVIFSNMVVFTAYAVQVIMAFMLFGMIFVMLPRAQISAKRINDVLDENISIKDGNLNINNTELKGCIEFKNVNFKYADSEDYILKNINLKINQGETVAFIGATGSGKSSLIQLITRFYDVIDGEVLVDGINVKDYNLEKLYEKIAYVPQKSVILKGSIKSNINYGKNNETNIDKALKEAIEISQVSEFYEKLDGKENFKVAQRGENLSGGQKQRLSIARALFKKPEIYIFDDSFSALDFKTDKTIRKNIKENTKDATCLIVAQRIGTIFDADKIVVLNDGEIVGIGKHQELLKTCKIYKEVALSQFKEEELG